MLILEDIHLDKKRMLFLHIQFTAAPDKPRMILFPNILYL